MPANLHRSNAICNLGLERFIKRGMSCRILVGFLALGLAGLGGCAASRQTAAWLRDAMPWPAREAGPAGPVSQKTVRAGDFLLTVRAEPFPLVLSQTRRVEAWITLKNRGKRFAQLEFPTTQRFDVSLRDEKGTVIAVWSEDQAFEPVPVVVGINPGEQVEYKAALATRDLVPGRGYTLCVAFVNRDDLKADLAVVPRK